MRHKLEIIKGYVNMSKLGRREFVYMTAMLGAAPVFANSHTRLAQTGNKPEDYYKLDKFGNVRVMHMTDCHAQLMPVYFREPSVNLGFFGNYGVPPHIVGDKLLDRYGIKGNKRLEYAFSCVNFEEHASKMGRVGGFAQLQTVVNYLRDDFGKENTIFMDGGDTWQGSWTSLQTRGKDMVGALNKLGVDVCTGHWEFTYKDHEVMENLKLLDADFVAQNVLVKEDALFEETAIAEQSYSLQNETEDQRMFKPYVMREMNGARVAVIGQAFPYTTLANPQFNMPDWSFAINEEKMQKLVDDVRAKEKPDAVIVISHNGYDVDKKMAEVCTGIDFIMGGHTHDGVPEAYPVKNAKGTTYVTNAGSNGKFLNVLDLEVKNGKIVDFKFTLLPIFSDLIPEDPDMKAYIEKVRAPYKKDIERVIATTDTTLYRRGNFNGSWDQIICDSLIDVLDAEISLSPGFRWGTSVMPGQDITFDDLATQTAMTYPETYVRPIKGSDIHMILEDVADNLFHEDPFRQQGGDMVRTGGISYRIDPKAKFGSRISNITMTKTGKPMDPNKMYRVAGWSVVGQDLSKTDAKPVWEICETYLGNMKHIKNVKVDTPDMVGVKGNPGIQLDC
jgi:sulfur-oxidizing protein SoxB